ncbi:MAG: NAD-dependent succinate-semialdehyde dehydrogenase [Chloroflexi bacterium]|nr:NAD-dependent succinate-semialdehyde dehydrogenase [Chloroflexota bacterium]
MGQQAPFPEADRAGKPRAVAERAAAVRALAEVLRARRDDWALLITREMGKPIVEAEAEIEKCAWNCEYFAEHGPGFLADLPVPTEARESYVAFDPLGVVLAIMPWNFPFWQVFRFLAPALVAGNTAVLKHAANVPGCALAIEEAVRQAGLPDGVLRTLLISTAEVEQVIADRRIAAVTLTGSSAAGEAVAAAAGKRIKKQVLELGGSDPFIVLADADLDAAARTAARARNQNSGQSCIAAKRFIVVDRVFDAFTERFVQAMANLRVGNPMERETQVGPMARDDLRHQLELQVRASVVQGAQVLLGGKRVPGRGYFYQPTVLSGINREMPVWREETFGPVAALMRARDEQEAMQLANDTQYGLGASIWTGDAERGKRLARRIEAGNVFINGMVASDPRLPFGGVKRSGYGRELGVFGVREFVNIKTIWVGPARGPQMPAPAQAPSE